MFIREMLSWMRRGLCCCCPHHKADTSIVLDRLVRRKAGNRLREHRNDVVFRRDGGKRLVLDRVTKTEWYMVLTEQEVKKIRAKYWKYQDTGGQQDQGRHDVKQELQDNTNEENLENLLKAVRSDLTDLKGLTNKRSTDDIGIADDQTLPREQDQNSKKAVARRENESEEDDAATDNDETNRSINKPAGNQDQFRKSKTKRKVEKALQPIERRLQEVENALSSRSGANTRDDELSEQLKEITAHNKKVKDKLKATEGRLKTSEHKLDEAVKEIVETKQQLGRLEAMMENLWKVSAEIRKREKEKNLPEK